MPCTFRSVLRPRAYSKRSCSRREHCSTITIQARRLHYRIVLARPLESLHAARKIYNIRRFEVLYSSVVVAVQL